MLSNQRQVIELPKFTYSPLGKAFEKQIKKQWKSKEEKQTDAIRNQDDHKGNYKKIFEELVKKLVMN